MSHSQISTRSTSTRSLEAGKDPLYIAAIEFGVGPDIRTLYSHATIRSHANLYQKLLSNFSIIVCQPYLNTISDQNNMS